jgi:drug/metabolite transporter (DMT)-like permease
MSTTAPPIARNRLLRDFVLLFIGATVVGTSSVLVRLAETPPATTAFWRMLIAVPVFVLWAALERRSNHGQGTGFTLAAIWPAMLAGLAFALDLVVSNISLGLTSMTSFIILVNLAPIMVVLVAWVWFREIPNRDTWLALALAFSGAVLMVQAGRSSGAPERTLLGDLGAIVAAVGYAGYLLATRKARLHGPTGATSLVAALSCAGFCLMAALALGEDLWPRSAWSWAMLLALGLGVHAFGQGLSAFAMGTLGASITAIVLLYGVAITVLGGFVVFNEVPNMLQLAGGALVLARNSHSFGCQPQRLRRVWSLYRGMAMGVRLIGRIDEAARESPRAVTQPIKDHVKRRHEHQTEHSGDN